MGVVVVVGVVVVEGVVVGVRVVGGVMSGRNSAAQGRVVRRGNDIGRKLEDKRKLVQRMQFAFV